MRTIEEATAVLGTPDEVGLRPVYRVVEYDPPEGGDGTTWIIMERKIVQVTPLKLRLDRPFPGSSTHGLLTKDSIGRLFHLTPTAALEHFRASSLRDLVSYSRKQDAARRELAWCDGELEAQRRRDEAATGRESGALFIIIAARDTTDLDQSTTDYAVCYLDDEVSASTLTERMNDLARRLETFVPPTGEAQHVPGASPDPGHVAGLRTLDPQWAPGSGKPTRYRVERVLPGKVPQGRVSP